MTVESLKNLPLVRDTDTPIPAAVRTFYQNNIALGTGPDGTFRLTDFFGTAAGIPANTTLTQTATALSAALADGILTDLDTLYSQMREVVTDGFGIPPSLVIPSGPAAGTYGSYNAALLALITAVDAEIGTVISALGSTTTALNTAWTEMATIFANEPTNQSRASINYATMDANAQLPLTAFIVGLDSYGQDTSQGGAAQLLEALADTTVQAGQAIIGAMREGRNDAALDSASIGHDNGVPDQPTTAPPQATLLDSQYTVAEARARTAALRG